MYLGERLVNLLLPDSPIIGQHRGAEHAWENNQIPILQASHFLRTQQGNVSSKLPVSWDVTSDSIAAWVTIHWPADELVLLKSCDYNEDNPDVDPHFSKLACEIPKISWVNLRDDTPQIQSCELR